MLVGPRPCRGGKVDVVKLWPCTKSTSSATPWNMPQLQPSRYHAGWPQQPDSGDTTYLPGVTKPPKVLRRGSAQTCLALAATCHAEVDTVCE
eukprot:4918322-Amphidinium_carterae.1